MNDEAPTKTIVELEREIGWARMRVGQLNGQLLDLEDRMYRAETLADVAKKATKKWDRRLEVVRLEVAELSAKLGNAVHELGRIKQDPKTK
jgi:hypothetical protein